MASPKRKPSAKSTNGAASSSRSFIGGGPRAAPFFQALSGLWPHPPQARASTVLHVIALLDGANAPHECQIVAKLMRLREAIGESVFMRTITSVCVPSLSTAEQFQATGVERFPATVAGAESIKPHRDGALCLLISFLIGRRFRWCLDRRFRLRKRLCSRIVEFGGACFSTA